MGDKVGPNSTPNGHVNRSFDGSSEKPSINDTVVYSTIDSEDRIDLEEVKRRSVVTNLQKRQERRSSLKYDDITNMTADQLYGSKNKESMGTNYKNTPTSLYTALRPLLFVMKVLGLYHSREWGGKAVPVTPSMVYSIIINTLLWANVFRYFTTYRRDEWYQTALFFKIVRHIWFFQCAICASVCFWASRGMPNMFKQFHEYMKHRTELTYRTYIIRASFFSMFLAVVVTIINVVIVGVWFTTNSQYSNMDISPFFRNQSVPAWFTVLYLILQFFASAAWGLTIALYVMLSVCLRKEFMNFALKFRLATSASGIFEGSIEAFRREHLILCKLVNTADGLINVFTLQVFGTGVPLVCFLIYNLMFEEDKSVVVFLMKLYWFITATAKLFITIGFASMLNVAGCAPKGNLHGMNLGVGAMNSGKMVQISLFLNKLTQGQIGFTGWYLFVVTRSTLISVFIAILGYMIVLWKLGTGFNPLARPTCTCNCAYPSLDYSFNRSIYGSFRPNDPNNPPMPEDF